MAIRNLVLLLVVGSLTGSALPVVAEIPCAEYDQGILADRHFLPVGDGSLSLYNAIASRDGFAYTIVKGSTSGSPLMLRCLEIVEPLWPTPVIRSFTVLPASSNRIVLQGNLAYLPLGSVGIGAVDVTDPDNLGVPIPTATPDVCRDLALLGNDHLVTAEWNALRIYFLQTPLVPGLVSTVYLTQARSVAVAGDLAFVACGNLGLAVVNVANPTAPFLVDQFPVGGFLDQVAAEGTTVYLTGYLLGLVTVDVTVPAVPQIVDILPIAGEPEAIALRDGFAYITTGGAVTVNPDLPDFDALALVRLNPTGSPEVVDYFFLSENYSALAVGDDLLLLGESVATSDLVLAPLQCAATSAVPEVAAPLVLAPPRPNPFNPRVEIRFELAPAVRGRLNVHDLRGRRIADLWAGAGDGRPREVSWDGRDHAGRACPSGTYHFRLSDPTGRHTVTTRATLLR